MRPSAAAGSQARTAPDSGAKALRRAFPDAPLPVRIAALAALARR